MIRTLADAVAATLWCRTQTLEHARTVNIDGLDVDFAFVDLVAGFRFPVGDRSLKELLQTLGQAQAASTSEVSDSGLTKRELEVLTLLAEGFSVQQISRRLGLSVHTTRGYVKTLLVKLEAHSQLEAVLVAARRGLIASVS